MNKELVNLIEYIKIHLVSLQQDIEDAQSNVKISENEYFESDDYYYGAINELEHILSVANDILSGDIQGKGY